MSIELNRFVIADVETFGLDPVQDPIIEVGLMVATLDLRVVSHFEILIWEADLYDYNLKGLKERAKKGDESSKIVYDMHTKSGLWDDAQNRGVNIKEAETRVLEWMFENGVEGKDPLTGSTAGFDRGMFKEHMPAVERKFHYRTIDISSVKELCLRYNPRVASKMGASTQPKKTHRSLSDCHDTLGELAYYVDNFLFVSNQDI